MRNTSFVAPLALLFALGLTGCGDSGVEEDQAGVYEEEQEAGAEETEVATVDEQQEQDARMQQQDPLQQQDPAAGSPGGAQVALTVEESQQFGEYLADAEGRPLYVYEQDSEGQSSCYDACAENWPPLTADAGMPSVDDPSIDPAQLGTIQRDDGKMQVTYEGKPLYYYAEDQGTGEPTGEQGDWALAEAGSTEMRRVSDEM